MNLNTSRHEIVGSARTPVNNAALVGPVPHDEWIEVSVRVRPRAALVPGTHPALSDQVPSQRSYLSRAEFAATHGASAADLTSIANFAARYALDIVESDAARRTVRLAGPASAMCSAFAVDLQRCHLAGHTWRGRSGVLSVPSDLADVVEGVFGLDTRPQAKPQIRRPLAVSSNFTPVQLSTLYGFPPHVDGTGQCIGLIELGGGFANADLQRYFQSLGLSAPSITWVGVDGGANSPTTPDSADGEVMLDIEVAGAIAPGASIVVYFAPNTDQGFLDAITTAVHDDKNKPSVISISWGAAESAWTDQAMTQYDQAFQAAAAMGVTICVAAGDNGSSDGVADGALHVDFPASSPYALACGGTTLQAHGGTISSEVVWNDGAGKGATGGGVSAKFALPPWQANAGVPHLPSGFAGRGVPDVAGDADPATGYQVLVDGQSMTIGGTSAVAPLWAGLLARLNQALGRPSGYLNPLLYGSLASQAVTNDITSGSNGAYTAAPGWDACTGYGSPRGQALLTALAAPPPQQAQRAQGAGS